VLRSWPAPSRGHCQRAGFEGAAVRCAHLKDLSIISDGCDINTGKEADIGFGRQRVGYRLKPPVEGELPEDVLAPRPLLKERLGREIPCVLGNDRIEGRREDPVEVAHPHDPSVVGLHAPSPLVEGEEAEGGCEQFVETELRGYRLYIVSHQHPEGDLLPLDHPFPYSSPLDYPDEIAVGVVAGVGAKLQPEVIGPV